MIEDLERQGKIAEAEFEAKAASSSAQLGHVEGESASAVQALEAQLEHVRAARADVQTELELVTVSRGGVSAGAFGRALGSGER